MVLMTSLDGKTIVLLKVLQDRVRCKEDKKSNLDLRSNEKIRQKARLKTSKLTATNLTLRLMVSFHILNTYR